jgi:signal transduction histidine kinase
MMLESKVKHRKTRMNRWRNLHRYRYLIIASAAILIATFGLVLMQYRSAQRAEEQARKTLEANLDLHLLSLVDEAKRDMLDRANHIFHSILQRRVRERDIPRLERAFTRAARRFPEAENFYVVFFEGDGEQQNWRVLRYERPDANDPNVTKFNGVPVGKLTEDAATTEALHKIWLSLSHQDATHAVTAYAPLGAENSHPQQIFFHIVYESDRLDRQDDLDRVGLLAFTARADAYPAPNYLSNLIARHAADETGSLGKLGYAVTLNDGNGRKLIAGESSTDATRMRKFEKSDNLFPDLSFGVTAPALQTNDIEDFTRSSILLGFGAAILSLIGLALTWRATGREMRVAQLKSDFLASISHELKTPLTAIRAFGDLIHSGRTRDAAKLHEYGAIIKTESDRLTGLINNILEMSRLERGLRRYRLEEGSLSATVAETVEVFRHTAGADGCLIKVELPPTPVKARFDENAIRQALLNLLSNAVKYSGETNDKKQIEVAVRREKSEAVIEVRDFGIGIAPAEKRHIFKAFHRAAQPEVQSERGTGLGLAIVREIARAHDGEVSFESELGAGAVFRLHLPLLADMTAQPAPAALEIN